MSAVDTSPKAIERLARDCDLEQDPVMADTLRALSARCAALEQALIALGPLLEGCDCVNSDSDGEPCPCALRRAALAGNESQENET